MGRNRIASINGDAGPLKPNVPQDLRLWTALFRDGPSGPIVSQVQSAGSKPCVIIEMPTGLHPEHAMEFLQRLFAAGWTIEEEGADDGDEGPG